MNKNLILSGLACFLLLATDSLGQSPLKMRDSTLGNPQTFAMIMGVSNYKYIRPLQYADKDAVLFRDHLRSPGGGSVPADNIFCLLNEDAINANFWSKGFQWLRAKQLRKGDRLFIYLAGHGDAIDEDQFFFLSYDCNPAGDKNNYLVGGTIQLFNLKKKIAAETAKGVEVVFIMDACRSNELPGGIPGQNFLNSAVSEKRAGEIIMLATGAGQASLEDASIGNGHGLFTYYLVDGLNGMADSETQPDQKITFAEIEEYVSKNVPSIARQRFKSNQQPYFCCLENNSKIISMVDTSWLRNWLQKKVSSGGNSFRDVAHKKTNRLPADTVLPETYNRFYQAIRNNLLTGPLSAEDYYNQLELKFPGSPYTLDARSSLSAAFIKHAQSRINDYLTCSQQTAAQQKENYEAGLGLEKAIRLVAQEDLDFARSLESRMYLLKTNNAEHAFENAFGALHIDPAGAYILNRLAILHLDAGNKDSALYYANKAAAVAPNWLCAGTTLSVIRNTVINKNNNNNKQQAIKRQIPKNSWGIRIGIASNQSKPQYSGVSNAGVIGTAGRGALSFDAGFIYMTHLSPRFAIRPSATISFETINTLFRRRNLLGEPFTETIRIKANAVNIAVPVIFRVADRSSTPYAIAGPSFSYFISQDDASRQMLPIRNSMLSAVVGLGVDISLPKTSVILSPELTYGIGLTDIKENASSSNAAALSSLKKDQVHFSLFIRKK